MGIDVTSTQPDNSDRRKLRIPVLIWDSQDGQRKGRGTETITRWLSTGELGFAADQLYPVGTVLRADLYLPDLPAPAPAKIRVERVEALQDREGFLIEASVHGLKDEHVTSIATMLEKLDLYQLLEKLLQAGATDLHLTVGSPPLMRQHGKIVPLTSEPIADGDIAAMLYPLLNEQQIENLEQNRELDFAFSPNVRSRFRVNMHWQRDFVEAALRSIPTAIKSFTELGLPAEPLRDLCRQKAGLILIAGATGSGKTTSLASMINNLNTTESVIVITIEDPIEYIHTSQKSIVKQREIGADTHSYGQALRRVLRQDPDVIVVGELLDGECLMAAMRAAETGHLVITTIHAPDTPQALQRVVNFFPPEHAANVCQQLSTCLVGVLYQTLVPSPSRGRVAATELMLNNGAMSNLIRQGEFSRMSSVLQTSRSQGMYTLKNSLQDLHERGLIEDDVLEGFKKLEFQQ